MISPKRSETLPFIPLFPCAGFPLHSGFVDVDSVVQMVRATGIHEARHPEAQFALAVQAFAYPHNVLSVWVYIASITPR